MGACGVGAANAPESYAAFMQASATRKVFIADVVLRSRPRTAGVDRLAIKQGSDKFLASVIGWKPAYQGVEFFHSHVLRNQAAFKTQSGM